MIEKTERNNIKISHLREKILKLLLFSLVCFLELGMIATAVGQESGKPDWDWENPIPTGNTLYGVAIPGPNKVIAVGGGGSILSTSNNGLTWNTQFIKNRNHLRLNSVFFINENIGWIVGDSGTILKTSDGGSVWSLDRSVTLLHQLKKVFFVNSNVGWIVGQNGLVIKTTDAGHTWAPQNTGSIRTMNSVFFLNETVGWACGDGSVLLRTINGGNKWDTLLVPAYTDYYDIYFLSATKGYLVGAKGLVSKTDDGGSTWQRIPTFTVNSFNSIEFVNSSSGIIVGDEGNWMKSSDGGTTWLQDSIETKNNLLDITSRATAGIWIAGESGALYSGVYNINTVWLPRSSGFRYDLNSITGIDSARLIAVGENGIVARSTNWGYTWITISDATINTLNCVDMIDLNNAVAVGDTGTVIRTSDGGITWQESFSGTGNKLYSVKYYDSQNLTAVGNEGTTIRSNDGGASWSMVSTYSDLKFKSHTYVNASTIWAAGEALFVTGGNDSIWLGRIFSSTDGGYSWTAMYSEPAPSFNKITSVSENVGFAVGNRGLIFATTDQGLTWRPRRAHNSSTNYLSVRFVDDTVGYITGHDGSVLRTVNGGTNWQWIATGTENRLNDNYFCTSLKGWAVGEYGSIIYTGIGGGTPIVIEPTPEPTPIPRVIKLLPSYPNPFNGSTTLAFALSEPANVTITIYDILGHRVKQFKVGQCESGVYDNQPGNKVAPVWDGRNEHGQVVASGCYISWMTTQQGQSSHKLLFVR